MSPQRTAKEWAEVFAHGEKITINSAHDQGRSLGVNKASGMVRLINPKGKIAVVQQSILELYN